MHDTPTATAAEPAPPRNGTTSRPLAVLALATVLLLFANGRDTVALAAWLAPVFLLRFTRARSRWSLAVAWLALAATWAFQFRGMAPLPPVGYALLASAFGVVLLVPFAVDRLLAPRLGGLASTLVLPCAWVSVEYLVATFTPYGSWGAAAYTQHGSPALMQLVSVTGLYGVGFLIAWCATVANRALERRCAWPEVRCPVLVFAVTILVVFAFGQARLAVGFPQARTVRVASLSKSDVDLIPSAEVSRRVYAGRATAEDREEIRRRAARIDDDLFTRSEREARAGAKIVFWGETNGFVFKQDEPVFLARAAELARSRGIYLGLGYGTWTEGADRPLENELVLIDPRGEVVLETLKLRPIPGGEAAISARDDGRVKHVDTPYGRLGAVICFDMDFPALLQQAGRAGVDLLLVPSNDWREIDPWHTHMARFRAVEQGFNLVRHASGGLSVATDGRGRILSRMDHYTTADRVLVSHLPTRRAVTLYALIGDAFAWLCLLTLAALALLAWRSGTAPPAAGPESRATVSAG